MRWDILPEDLFKEHDLPRIKDNRPINYTKKQRIQDMFFRPNEYPDPFIDPIDFISQNTLKKSCLQAPGRGFNYQVNDLGVGNKEFQDQVIKENITTCYETC